MDGPMEGFRLHREMSGKRRHRRHRRHLDDWNRGRGAADAMVRKGCNGAQRYRCFGLRVSSAKSLSAGKPKAGGSSPTRVD